MNKSRAVLRRRWPLLVATLILGIIAGAVSSTFATEQVDIVYSASQTIVANRNATGYNVLVPQDTLKITRGEVPTLAAQKLGEPDRAADLAATITTAFDEESSSITVSSKNTDPDVAAARTAAFVDAFLEMTNASLLASSQQQLEDRKEQLERARSEYADYEAALGQAPNLNPLDPMAQAALSELRSLQSNVESLDRDVRTLEAELTRNVPYESLGPEAPKTAETGLLSVPSSLPVRASLLGAIGLLLGGVVVLVIERLNPRVDTRDELVDLVEVPVLAEVGLLKKKQRPTRDDGSLVLSGPWAEPFRSVRSAVQFVQNAAAADGAVRPSVFLVTSSVPNEGKSTTSALVAQALAEVALPTVVVGGDFRKPEVDRLLGAASTPSLRDLARLNAERPSIDVVIQNSPVHDDLYVAAAGPATREVAGLLNAARDVCVEAVNRGATVVIDSSPMTVANDTTDLLPVVDYVVVVVRSGAVTESALLESLDAIKRQGRPVLGLVLIGTPSTGRKQAYYYDYYKA